MFLTTFGLVWVFPASIRNFFPRIEIRGAQEVEKKALRPIGLVWCIWEEPNEGPSKMTNHQTNYWRISLSVLFVEWSQQFLGFGRSISS